jgi:hypothetical protein
MICCGFLTLKYSFVVSSNKRPRSLKTAEDVILQVYKLTFLDHLYYCLQSPEAGCILLLVTLNENSA